MGFSSNSPSTYRLASLGTHSWTSRSPGALSTDVPQALALSIAFYRSVVSHVMVPFYGAPPTNRCYPSIYPLLAGDSLSLEALLSFYWKLYSKKPSNLSNNKNKIILIEALAPKTFDRSTRVMARLPFHRVPH